MAPDHAGRPSDHGASELCGAWAGKVKHVKACEEKAPCPEMKTVRSWVAESRRSKDLLRTPVLRPFLCCAPNDGGLHVNMVFFTSYCECSQ